jgi:hypothetical protein
MWSGRHTVVDTGLHLTVVFTAARERRGGSGAPATI